MLKLSSFFQLPATMEFISFASRNLKALKQQFSTKPKTTLQSNLHAGGALKMDILRQS